SVAKNAAGPVVKNSMVTVATSQDRAAELVAAGVAQKAPGSTQVMLRSPWAPVDERPYAAGELEAVASAVVANAAESASAAAAVQLVTFENPGDDSLSGSLAGSPPGWRLALEIMRAEGGGRVAARVLDSRPLPAGWAGWSED